MNAPITRWDFATAATPNASYRVAVEQTVAPAQAAPAPTVSIARRAADAIAYVIAFPRRRMAMAELASLTDRELADIGLSRSELRQVFKREFLAQRASFRSL